VKIFLKYIFLFLFALPFGESWRGVVIAQPQNLVPNHSFEQYVNCPQTVAPNSAFLSNHVENWFSASFGISSPDYFNRCNTNFMSAGIPLNYVGEQEPSNGSAYAGIYVWTTSGFREFVEIQLIHLLQANKTYYIELYVSFAEGISIACHTLGVYFSQNMLWCNGCYYFSIIPQIENTKQIQALTDRENWMKISGTFIAQGGEKYLTIGNFRDTNNLELDTISSPLPWGGNPSVSYYYIDDVFLYDYEDWQAWQDSLNNNIPEPNPLKLPNAFSPNGDGMNDFFVIEGVEQYPHNELYIYNRWGELVYYKENYDNSFKGESNTKTPYGKQLTEGTYFYIFRTGIDNESYTGFLELRR
jgi:gliding motility-associated-like protein